MQNSTMLQRAEHTMEIIKQIAGNANKSPVVNDLVVNLETTLRRVLDEYQRNQHDYNARIDELFGSHAFSITQEQPRQYNDPNENIRLNIGGVFVSVTVGETRRFPGALLYYMFSGRYTQLYDKDNRVFLDRPWKYARHVVEYYTSSGIINLSGLSAWEVRRVRREFAYFLIFLDTFITTVDVYCEDAMRDTLTTRLNTSTAGTVVLRELEYEECPCIWIGNIQYLIQHCWYDYVFQVCAYQIPGSGGVDLECISRTDIPDSLVRRGFETRAWELCLWGENILVSGGYNKRIFRFDPITTEIHPFKVHEEEVSRPTKSHKGHHSMVASKGKLYITGGSTTLTSELCLDTLDADVRRPISSTWSGAPALVYKTRTEDQGTNNVDVFDSATSTWSALPPLQSPVTTHVCFVSNGHLHVLGRTTKSCRQSLKLCLQSLDLDRLVEWVLKDIPLRYNVDTIPNATVCQSDYFEDHANNIGKTSDTVSNKARDNIESTLDYSTIVGDIGMWLTSINQPK